MCSLESPRLGDSNEYPHHMFLWRNVENYPLIICQYPPYLFHCRLCCFQELQQQQRVCNMVSEVMHSISHSYHALSDLMVDLSQQRPRQLYVTLAIAQPHTAVIQQTIPVQVNNVIFYGV